MGPSLRLGSIETTIVHDEGAEPNSSCPLVAWEGICELS